ncbi:MAG: hypothetical protein ACE141_07020 [Bryobacteraceae bacterium]
MGETRYYAAMALGLARWARVPLEPDPQGLICRSLHNRERNFLDLMKHAVFDNPANPYHTLFSWAGCTYGDLERTVRREGLEAALETLYRAGVYLTHDEFKGKTAVERSGRQIMVSTPAFANPRFTGVVEMATSSGSRSLGTVTKRSLEYQIYREAQNLVMTEQYEPSTRALVAISRILPSTGGIRRALNYARRGNPHDRWFALGGDRRATHYRLLTLAFLVELRLLGVPATLPTWLPQNDFRPVARWIAHRRRQGVPSLVMGAASCGVRAVVAAQELGLDISGTLFLLGGEALTAAKRAAIEASGCEVHSRYAASELGTIGVSCRRMQGNCVHVSLDSIAVLSRRRLAPLSGVEVDSLLLTPLLPSAPTVVVNVEMDDAGTLGTAKCDCGLSALGLTTQLDNIFSYGKLTGGGVTLLSGGLLQILEQSLPARFGGVSSDFQLVEHEGAGQTEIELRAHPRLGGSEDEIKRFFLGELRRVWGGGPAGGAWTQMGALRVVLAEPHSMGGGKINLLHQPRPQDQG